MHLAILLLLRVVAPDAFAGIKLSDDVRVKIQKPEVAIIMNKQNLTPKYDLELQQSFLPKVVESVEQKPF